jgi:PAS domain S-box-containing protein
VALESSVERAIASPSLLNTPPLLAPELALAAVEFAPDGIAVCDSDGRIMMANRHMEELFGYEHGELTGAIIESLVPEQLRRVHRNHRSSYADAPAIRTMGSGLDLVGRRADGSEFPIEVSLSPIATDSGTSTVVVARENTAQRTEEQITVSEMLLEQEEHIATVLCDRVIRHLSASSLRLSSILCRDQLDTASTIRINEAIEELDAAIREIRTAVFVHVPERVSGQLSGQRVLPHSPAR